MRVLFLDHPEADNLTALVYLGLCQELGADSVVDWPWQPTFHGEVFRGQVPSTPNGVAAPFPWMPPQQNKRWSDEDVLSKINEFDLVILASPRQYNSARLESLIARFGRGGLRRLVMMDGEDYTSIRWDLVNKFKPSVYFKVSLVREPLEVFAKQKTSGCRVVPFAMATTATDLVECPKDIDACLLGGGNWRGPHREGVRENRPLLKPLYERRLIEEFAGSYKVVTGGLPYSEYLTVLSRAKVAVTLGGHGIEPVRSYDTLAAPGTLLLRASNDHIAPAPLLHGVNCATFHSLDEMVQLTRHFMIHDDERVTIAKRGRDLVQEHYTPRARARHLLREALL